MPTPSPRAAAADYARIERVIRHLDGTFRSQPGLADLARVAGVSEFHFHRLFSRWAGTTPKQFLKSLTAAHAKRLLRETRRDLLDVAFEAGLSGPGRLHDLLVTVEGVSPGEWKRGGEGIAIRYGFHETPFGRCLLASTSRGICHLSFVSGGDAAALEALRADWPKASLVRDQRATGATAALVFSRRRSTGLTALVTGTPFQLKVWEALVRIPPGCAISYGDLAAAIGKPRAARAVGSAVARNSVAYLIPCHRVIRETGVIGEYRWGSERKAAILGWEGRSALPITNL